jgi:hypothetical protein
MFRLSTKVDPDDLKFHRNPDIAALARKGNRNAAMIIWVPFLGGAVLIPAWIVLRKVAPGLPDYLLYGVPAVIYFVSNWRIQNLIKRKSARIQYQVALMEFDVGAVEAERIAVEEQKNGQMKPALDALMADYYARNRTAVERFAAEVKQTVRERCAGAKDGAAPFHPLESLEYGPFALMHKANPDAAKVADALCRSLRRRRI